MKINVMLVITSVSGAGAELVVSNLCKFLDKNKFNISVCHLKDRGERGDELFDAGYDIVGLTDNEKNIGNYLSSLYLRKLILRKDIDIIHSHDRASLYDCGFCKLTTNQVKHIHTFHYGNYPILPRRHLMLEKLFSTFSDKLVAVGCNQKSKIIKTFTFKKDKIETVYNGIEIIDVEDNKHFYGGKKNDQIVIGTISTMTKQKGIDNLLRIASEVKKRQYNVLFLVAGDGPLRLQLEQKNEEMQLTDIVKFLGWVPNAAEKVLPKIHIFLQTSLWEAMSVAVLEAMSAGKPIVATDVGENRIIVEKIKNGFISNPGDINLMVDYLERLIRDPKLRLTFGEKGKAAVREFYSVQVMAGNYERIYRDTMSA